MTQPKIIDDAKPASALPPLGNIIFQALATRQAGVSQTAGEARRFLPEIGPLAGFSKPADPDFDALAQLAWRGPVVIFLDAPFQPRAGWKAVDGGRLVLMVWQGSDLVREDSCAPILKLGVEDSADMLKLTAMTKPGPFGPRTHELGSFFGIRIGNRLAAMAGERLKVDGYTEVSAVCTHPDHLGKGYAATLMRTVMRGILERGETPFLHSRADNARAIALYERLGFRHREAGHFVVLERE
jgi:ribosomal protein S18 acetylase RimI-like enzyme